MRPLVRLAAVLGGACAATAARAESPAVELRIDCPSLDDEARTLLEARARAQLASERLPGGELVIACVGASATLAWQPVGGASRERTMVIEGEPASEVDALLAAIHALVAVQAPAAPLPPVGAAAAPAGSTEPTEPAPPRREPSPFAVLAGVDSELWQGGIAAAGGGHAGVVFSPGRRWSLVVLAGPAWGLSSADGLHAWRLRGVARVDYALLPALRIGLGASGRILWADAVRGDVPPQRTGATAGGLLSARYVLPLGPIVLGVGPEVEALVQPISVDVAGAEVFRMPTFVVGLSVEGSGGL